MQKRVYNKSQFLPRINKYIVFKLLKQQDSLSVDNIVMGSGISKPTVTKILKELLQDDYIEIIGKGDSIGGRRPDLYKLKTDARIAIGVDIEIPRIRIVAVDLADNIIERKSFKIDTGSESPLIMEMILRAVDEVLNNANTRHRRKLIGIGVSISGFIDQVHGISLMTPRILNWKNVPIIDPFQKRFHVPVQLVNDTDSRALAEIEFGHHASIDTDDLLYIAFNEGIGAAIFQSGELISGRFGNAGSISHQKVESHGKTCICGNSGCLETYASERGVIKNVIDAYRLQEKRSGDDGGISIEEIYSLYKEGDPVVCPVLEEAARYLGIGISNLITILESHTILIGGSIVSCGESFLKLVKDTIEKHVQPILREDLIVEYASLDDSYAGARGAVIPIQKEFFKGPELEINSKEIRVMSPTF